MTWRSRGVISIILIFSLSILRLSDWYRSRRDMMASRLCLRWFLSISSDLRRWEESIWSLQGGRETYHRFPIKLLYSISRSVIRNLIFRFLYLLRTHCSLKRGCLVQITKSSWDSLEIGESLMCIHAIEVSLSWSKRWAILSFIWSIPSNNLFRNWSK